MKTIKNKKIVMIAIFTFFISASVFSNNLFASENEDTLPKDASVAETDETTNTPETTNEENVAPNEGTNEQPDTEITISENEEGTVDIEAVANGEDVSELYQSMFNEEEDGDQKTYSIELDDIEVDISEEDSADLIQ